MPFPLELDRVLMGAPQNTPLRVQHIAPAPLRDRCAREGIREGEELTCLGSTPSHLLIELPARRWVMVEREIGMFIEVERIGPRPRTR